MRVIVGENSMPVRAISQIVKLCTEKQGFYEILKQGVDTLVPNTGLPSWLYTLLFSTAIGGLLKITSTCSGTLDYAEEIQTGVHGEDWRELIANNNEESKATINIAMDEMTKCVMDTIDLLDLKLQPFAARMWLWFSDLVSTAAGQIIRHIGSVISAILQGSWGVVRKVFGEVLKLIQNCLSRIREHEIQVPIELMAMSG